MSRTFLKPDRVAEAGRHLCPPAEPPDGETAKADHFGSAEFSDWLLSGLLDEWRGDPDFVKAGPVMVGSGARRELCPRSDLDLLFTGPEESVRAFVRRAQESGVRIRARSPEDASDWSVGVDVPDILALVEARALSEAAEIQLRNQQEILTSRGHRERRSWLKVLIRERSERESRYDSIANYLEPNLKYGPGGLRDLDQGRQVARLFPERFTGEDSHHAHEILAYYARFWTLLRQKLHLEGHGDVLVSAAQFDLARWLGMEHKTFMRQVQRGLSRVHFYSRWIIERARVSEKVLRASDAARFPTRAAAVQALEKSPSVVTQEHVRRELDRLFPWSWAEKSGKERGALLDRVLRPGADENFIVAVFGARIMDRLCPELFALVGHVQHDQYHRYTADIHLQQACREFQRVLKKPRRLGVLAMEVTSLTAFDRRVLGWSVLYHDLMKGHEGDHSKLGRDLVLRDFRRFGLPKALAEEVAWMVEHHLELSLAAFRRNPRAPSTWSGLRAIGAEGARLRRLAVFTVIDICATNPEAWTPWKARLLRDLLHAFRSPSAVSYFRLEKALSKAGVPNLTAVLDGSMMEQLPPRLLAEDLAAAVSAKESLPPRVLHLARGGTWVRFHNPVDRPGIFSEWVQRLYSLGLGIRHAAVQTLPGIGVYDWFQVSTKRSPAQLKTWLGTAPGPLKKLPNVSFEKISLVSEDPEEWVLSFKGMDQPGCLAAAAAALASEGVSIRSARVHTWGRQVDDLFHVIPRGEAKVLVEKLRMVFSAHGST